MTEQTGRPVTHHRIWHGKSEERLAILPENSVDLVVTDPPFGVDNQSNMSVTAEGKSIAQKIANDGSVEEAEKTFNAVMDVLLPKTKADCDLYVFTSDEVLEDWLRIVKQLTRHGFEFKRTLIWRKADDLVSAQTPGMGDVTMGWGSGVEFILYLKKGKKPMYGDRRGAVIDCQKVPSGKLIHPHEKPIRLIQTLIEMSSVEGDLVVDPFCGSGATLRAAEASNRSCITVEYLEHNYLRALDKFEKDTVGLF